MHTTTRKLLYGATVLTTMTLALPAAASAQQRLAPVQVTAAAAARADALDARAAKYEAVWRHTRKAAKLREQAAELRAPGDGRAVTSLQTAANLRYQSGQRASAADLMERAADRAIARGDVVTAIDSYMITAIVAAEIRQPDRARTLVERADVLLHSPLLSEGQRESLRARVATRDVKGVEVASLLKP